ncbi:hypothetical protein HID58_086869 [Brassica napus]|uniref:Uncharacterized protein n=1 Tax=Brassica napus TaxID=3708 RepID=A0ABQ7XRP5_BRANA|nr:hypothetical protein HID58_086869 [Brassica napus]
MDACSRGREMRAIASLFLLADGCKKFFLEI